MSIDLNDMIRRTLEEIAGPDKTTALPYRQPAASFRIALLVLPEIELQKKDESAKNSRKNRSGRRSADPV